MRDLGKFLIGLIGCSSSLGQKDIINVKDNVDFNVRRFSKGKPADLQHAAVISSPLNKSFVLGRSYSFFTAGLGMWLKLKASYLCRLNSATER